MLLEVVIPILPESIEFAKISSIYVEPGVKVSSNEVLFDVETDKVILEVTALKSGVIDSIDIIVGQTVNSEQLALRLTASSDRQVNNEQKDRPMSSKSEYIDKSDSSALLDNTGLLLGMLVLAIGSVFGGLVTLLMLT